MVKLFKRFIRLLIKFSLIKNIYILKYKGQGVTLNDYYSQGHWTKRNNIKKEYSKIAKVLISDYIPKGEFIEHFACIVFYNSRHDPDNVSGFSKIIVDQLVSDGIVQNDSKNFHKFFAIIPDTEMEKNSFEFNIVKIK